MSASIFKTIIYGVAAGFNSRRGVFMLLAAFSALTLVDVPGVWNQAVYIAIVAVLKATVMTLIFGSVMGHRRWLDNVCYLLIVLYCAVAVANFVSYEFYGIGISRSLFIVALQTNSREASEFSAGVTSNFLTMATSWRLWAIVATAVILWLIIRRLPAKLFVGGAVLISIVGAVALGDALLNTNRQRTMNIMGLRLLVFGYDAWQAQGVYDSMITDRRPFPNPGSVKSTHNVADMIVIIGESASRSHHSLYGYPLETTPRLASLGDNLFVFTQATAASSTTVENMERIMTFMRGTDTYGVWTDFPSIIDLMSNAGYRTWFMSNQEKYGAASGRFTLDGVFAAQADVGVFTGQLSARDVMTSRYDGLLLPVLDKALADTASLHFIVMHLMGSHQIYSERYPPEAARFTAADILPLAKNRPWLTESRAQTVAEYDNSILYTDSIVSAAIARVSHSPRPSVVIYLSDHGEDVYDTSNRLMRSANTLGVPFVIYVNDAWLNANLELAAQMRATLGRRFHTSDIIYTVMTLSGTSYPLYDASRDVISPLFLQRIPAPKPRADS